MISNWFYEGSWQLERVFKRVKCFFTGHDARMGCGMYYEPNWCAQCYTDDPQKEHTLPGILNRIYVAIVHQEWSWFDTMDNWLCAKCGKYLPSWWEY